MRKKYIEPKIKAVELNAEQAIIQVCAIGGNYFASVSACLGNVGTGPVRTCALEVKGRTTGTGGGGDGNNMPS